MGRIEWYARTDHDIRDDDKCCIAACKACAANKQMGLYADGELNQCYICKGQKQVWDLGVWRNCPLCATK